MSRIAALLLVTLTVLSSAAFASTASTSKNPVFSPYETIRQALLHDTLDGVGDAAKSLAASSKKLSSGADDASAKKSLESVATFSTKMVSASDIETARMIFGDLSEAIIGYRNTVQGTRPIVAKCSMANKQWLQPDDKIGNPYYGQSMASCGEIVSRDEKSD
jgi:hypothetical protein